jgi:predicted phage-related endonuclease
VTASEAEAAGRNAAARIRPFTVGGSEAAAACGVDPYQSRVMLWARKTGRVAPPVETEAMRWGNLLQPVILDVLAKYGYDVMPAPADAYRDQERPYIVGHPDAFGVTLDGPMTVIYAKTTGPWGASSWADDGAPTGYIVQLHHYMHLTGLDHGLLACLVAGQRLELRTVERDQTAIDLMLALLDEFAGYVERDEPPPPAGTDSDTEALRAMFPGGGERVELDSDGMDDVRGYRVRDRAYQACKRQRDEYAQRIKLAMGDCEAAVSPAGEVVAKWSTYLRDGKPLRRFTVV